MMHIQQLACFACVYLLFVFAIFISIPHSRNIVLLILVLLILPVSAMSVHELLFLSWAEPDESIWTELFSRIIQNLNLKGPGKTTEYWFQQSFAAGVQVVNPCVEPCSLHMASARTATGTHFSSGGNEELPPKLP